MENLEQAKHLVSEAKSIYIIPEENSNPDAVAAALALFYTLKELDKNVNLIIDELPEKFRFLIPSADFISLPKNFVISIPSRKTDVSQIYYEKNNEGLKIYLTVNKGNVKKDDISFYFSEAKPDLIITIGIKDFKAQLLEKLNFCGFLLDSPILNIDNNSPSGEYNKNFGKINLIRSASLAEMALDLVKNPHIESIKKEAATCFLAGIAVYTENFGNLKVTPEIFETASLLMKRGADLKEIKDNFFKKQTD
ncbi:MAG: Uncharacterized protein CEN87_39 [Parcubacteria group bacterium Licking1014_1]|nr:MAG: Uncharacterized protein CEN87_39 [Parcubacteria group bacterium Licking1014_1]